MLSFVEQEFLNVIKVQFNIFCCSMKSLPDPKVMKIFFYSFFWKLFLGFTFKSKIHRELMFV